eukprot:6438906-Ditylum_brightwellii.AAC.1
MKSFKTLCIFVSLILAVHASKAIEEPERRTRGLKGSTTSAPKKSKGGIDAPKTTKAKGGIDVPKTSNPTKAKGAKSSYYFLNG